MYVCLYVYPAKTVGRKELPFGRVTCVVPSYINIVLDRGPVPQWEGEIWGSEVTVSSDAMPPMAKLLGPLLAHYKSFESVLYKLTLYLLTYLLIIFSALAVYIRHVDF